MLKHRLPIYIAGLSLGLVLSIWIIRSREHLELPTNNPNTLPVTQVHKALTQIDNWLNVEKKIEAKQLAGRLVLLHFWSYCCPTCENDFANIKQLQKKFGDKLTVISVHSAPITEPADQQVIVQLLNQHQVNFPVVHDAHFLHWRTFGIKQYPTLVVMNPIGQRTIQLEGKNIDYKKLDEKITEAISQFGDRIHTSPIEVTQSQMMAAVMVYPRLQEVEKQVVSPEAKLQFDLPEGWHVLDHPRQSLQLPEKMEKNKQYYVEGTAFFYAPKDRWLCSLQSFQFEVDTSGTSKTIRLKPEL